MKYIEARDIHELGKDTYYLYYHPDVYKSINLRIRNEFDYIEPLEYCSPVLCRSDEYGIYFELTEDEIMEHVILETI